MGKLIHGQARRGQKTRTYRAWEAMMRRCYNKRQRSYRLYGGRGIRVCVRWHDFEEFRVDMGECPDGMTLDRKDSAGNYEPGNCRWADYDTQGNNTSRNRRVEFGGQSLTLAQWSRETGISERAIWMRLFRYGWTAEQALTKGAAA